MQLQSSAFSPAGGGTERADHGVERNAYPRAIHVFKLVRRFFAAAEKRSVIGARQKTSFKKAERLRK